MLVAAALAGAWISDTMSRSAIESTAASTALFMDSFLTPLVQELATNEVIGRREALELDRLLKAETFVERFPHVEIWTPDGSVAYSTSAELIGSHFPPSEGLESAFRGQVAARYTDLEAGEHVVRNFSSRYLEIYVPIREHLSGRVIAVAEIHEVTAPLEQKLRLVRLQSWAAVIGATLLVMLALFSVVHRGSRLIERHRAALRTRLAEIERVSEQNVELREKAQRASARVSEMNEGYLRNVAAELHDGPAQLISLAVLRVELARRAATTEKREQELKSLEHVLADALGDIRMLSKGLMLPEIEDLPLHEVIGRVSRVHEKRTGTTVSATCPDIDIDVSHAVKICVYRFVQEGLNNAFRHARGDGQAVECTYEDDVLSVAVSDDGGYYRPERSAIVEGLGLTGLRERVESLGGTMSIQRHVGGTTIAMSIALTEGLQDD